jgi:hypothetical protein
VRHNANTACYKGARSGTTASGTVALQELNPLGIAAGKELRRLPHTTAASRPTRLRGLGFGRYTGLGKWGGLLMHAVVIWGEGVTTTPPEKACIMGSIFLHSVRVAEEKT